MRKLLIICAIVALASGGAHALPSRPYVGLYADGTHSITSVKPPAFVQFQLWIWWLPSERGLMAADFDVAFPANVVVLASVQNPQLCVCLGRCLGPHFCPLFDSCQPDWVWTHQLTCMVTDPAPGFIEIGPLPGTTEIYAANCEAGYPMEAVAVFDRFGINQDAVVGVEPQSWGAIKSIYR